MGNVTKPTSKGKFDGVVDYLCSDDARFLVMRGDYTKEEIIRESVAQNVVDVANAEEFASSARYYQCWYKVSPIGGQEGYANWHHPRDTPCRGAYFASVLEWN